MHWFFRLLRAPANYFGGAAAGMGLATLTGQPALGASTIAAMLLACVLAESVTEGEDSSARLNRVEVWLEELIRRHGQLDVTLQAIADGKETLENVDRQLAARLLHAVQASDESLKSLVESDAQIRHALDRIDARSVVDQRFQQLLERKTEQLIHIGVVANEKLDTLIARNPDPTAAELRARSIDNSQHCELRARHLQDRADELEYTAARNFAEDSAKWLERQVDLSPESASALALCLLDHGSMRVRTSPPEERADAILSLQSLERLASTFLGSVRGATHDRLSSMLIYVESLLRDRVAALRKLEGRVDPWGMRRRIVILCDSARPKEAVDLFRGARPEPEWIERGIMAAIEAKDWDEANRLLAWSLTGATPNVQTRCRLRFVEAAIHSLPEHTLSVSSTAAADTQRMTDWRDILAPLVAEVQSLSTVRHERDTIVLRCELDLALRLNDAAGIEKVAGQLATKRPLEKSLAVLAVRGRIEAARDWPQRLRAEGPSSFERKFLAIVIEARSLDRRASAFRSGMALVSDSLSREERGKIHGILSELVQQLGEDETRELSRVRDSLLTDDPRQLALWKLGAELKAGKIDGVDAELERLRNGKDSLWLQLYGQRQLSLGNEAEGSDSLCQAALLLDHPSTLHKVASVAIGYRQWEPAKRVLERLMALRPKDAVARSSMALTLFHLADYIRAGDLLRDLSRDFPNDPMYAVNAATCYLRAGYSDRSIELLRSVCSTDAPPVQAVTALAQLLVDADQPHDAFALMTRFRGRFWERYEFVAPFWSIAFAAEREDAGHDALVQMRRLQVTGSAPADILVEGTLDDLIRMREATEERRTAIAKGLLTGSYAWTTVSDALNQPYWSAWDDRTSIRKWIFEHPVNIAESTIYATHGFVPIEDSGSRTMFPITGPPAGQPVVADLSALVTLSELKLLDDVVRYCGRLVIPASYQFKLLQDMSRLRPSQPSRKTILSELTQALADGRLHHEADRPLDETAYVDEHYLPEDPPPNVYHLIDILNSMRTHGVATDADLQRASRVASRRPTVADGHPALTRHHSVQISLSTLSSLHDCGLLEQTLQHLTVHISASDVQIIRGDTQWFAKQVRLRHACHDLSLFLRGDPRIELSGQFESEEVERRSALEGVSLHSVRLAEHTGLPMVADDRCLQSAVQRRAGTTSSTACGSGHLIHSMWRAGALESSRYSAAMVALMKRRYRFLLFDADLLLLWARKSMSAAPGPHLQAAAVYIQDCMRDPGLFNGMESTTPPTTMGMKIGQHWEYTIGEFLGIVWTDDEFAMDHAKSLTRWSMQYLRPALPLMMEPRVKLHGDLRMAFFWQPFLFRLARCRPELMERTRMGVAYVGEVLGLTSKDLARTTAEVASAIG